MKITCRAFRLFDSQGHCIIFPSGNGCWEGNYVLSTVIKFIFSMTLQLSLWIAVLFPPKSWPWWAGCQNNLFSKLNPQLFVPLLTGMVDAAYVWRSRAQRHRQLEDRAFLPGQARLAKLLRSVYFCVWLLYWTHKTCQPEAGWEAMWHTQSPHFTSNGTQWGSGLWSGPTGSRGQAWVLEVDRNPK